MGMYTEIFFRADIKHDADPEVLALLGRWVNGRPDSHDIPRANLPEHEFFDCPRWENLASNGDAYFPHAYGSRFSKKDWGKGYSLALHCTLKNYHSEIEKFFDWINPYVDALEGEFIGHSLYEDVDPGSAPTPYFKLT
jgi:hypothetical protein